MATLFLKVEIDGISPKIYRDITVDSNISFQKLHHILQIAFDWTNSHLYQFEVGDEIICEDDPESGMEGLPAGKTKLKDHLYKGSKFTYEYDFGDSWIHNIKVVEMLDIKDKFPYCVGGKRSAPPEDCGGVPGYVHMLEVMKNKKSPEYKEMMEWSGDFEPEHFDKTSINEELAGIDSYIKRMKQYAR